MVKKYVIRQVAFRYSDDHFYSHEMGGIKGDIFTDYVEAHNTLMELERDSYLATDLGDIEPFSACSSDVNMDKIIQLKIYVDQQLGQNILKIDNYGRISADRETYLTKNITNEQLSMIRFKSGLKFYELVEFADEPQFFGIWEKSPFHKSEGFRSDEGTIYFYNTYVEAYNEAIKYCSYSNLNDTKIKGKLEDITDMPMILKSLLKNSNDFNYDEVVEELTIKNTYTTEWGALSTLLRNKPFEIRLLTFDDVKGFNESM